MSSYDYKLLKKAKRERGRKAILREIRNVMIGPRGSEASIAAFGEKYPTTVDQYKAREKYMFTGKGAYGVNDFMRDAGTIGEGIKKTYNAWVPKSIRRSIINRAGGFIGKGLYTGRGGYVANELVAGGEPSMTMSHGDETESITISNREYISDIYGPGSSAFTNNAFVLNPGLQQNFPWLAQLAANYEEYEFEKLVFMFKTTVDLGNATTAGQAGTIIMACDYNASHDLFLNKEVMMQYHGAVSAKTTDDMVCGIECDYTKTANIASFIRTGPVPYGEDPKTYDLGIFQYAINNCPAVLQNQQIGELWVEYTCRLKIPKLTTSRGMFQQRDIYIAPSGATLSATSFMGTIGLGTTVHLKGLQNNIGSMLSYSTATFPASQTDAYGSSYVAGANKLIVTLPVSLSGSFRINLSARATSFTSINWAPRLIGQFTKQLWSYSNSGGPDDRSGSSTGGAIATGVLYFRVAAATGGVNNMIILDTTTWTFTGTLSHSYIEIIEDNPSFVTTNANTIPQWTNSQGIITLTGY
jgi:hypothetical protein